MIPLSGNTCVECTDEDVLARLGQLSDYVKPVAVTGDIYNITWSKNKVNCEEVLDMDGKSQSPKVYVKSHFKGDKEVVWNEEYLLTNLYISLCVYATIIFSVVN